MGLFPRHNRQNVSSDSVVQVSPVVFATRGLSFTTSVGLVLTALLSHAGDTMAQTVPLPTVQSQTYAQANGNSISAPTSQQILFVNSRLGSDGADGSQRSPFRTLTHALQMAQPNTVIMLAVGTYSADTGERFPLVMQPGVTIQGDPSTKGQGITIRGGGIFLSPTSAGQNVTLLAADQAQLVGVTVTNPDPRGYGLWVESSDPVVMSNTFTGSGHDGISTVGDSAARIVNNVFSQNGANGITIFGASRPEVRENVFERTGYGINVAEQAAPLIVDNRISQNRIGVVVQENARPVLRGNTIEGNRDDGVAAIANAQPNLGTANDPGNNVFQNNGQLDINANASSQTIPAFGNQIAADRTNGKIDLTGTVAVTPLAGTIAANSPVSTSPLIVSTPQAETIQAQAQTQAQPQTQAQAQAQGQSQILRSAPSQVYQATTGAITELPPPITTPPPNNQTVSRSPAQSIAPTNQTANGTRVATVSATIPAPPQIAAPPPINAIATMHPAVAPRVATASTQSSSTAMVPATATIAVPPPLPLQPTVATVSLAPSPVQSASSPAINIPVPPPAQSQQPTRSTATRSASSTAVTPTSSTRTNSTRTPSTARTNSTANTRSTSTASSRSSGGQTLAYTASAAFTAPINIPVPPPESSQIPPAQVMSRVPTPPVVPNATQSNLLPVPGETIPVGNIGDLPTVAVSRNPTLRADSRTSSSSRSRANLRYRVVVSASSERTQSLVQSIVPSAFVTSINGQELMQVGAFSTRDNAEQAVEMLNQNGLDAVIQEMN